MSEQMSQSRSRPSRASLLFHLAFALGFVPLLGVVLAAVGLAATHRDPAAARWKRPLIFVLIFDAVVWPTAACVWLFGEPLVTPAAPVEGTVESAFWDFSGPVLQAAVMLVLLVGLLVYFRNKGRLVTAALAWVLIAALVAKAVELVAELLLAPEVETAVDVLILTAPSCAALLAIAAVAFWRLRGRFDVQDEPIPRLSSSAGIGLGLLYVYGGVIRYTALVEMLRVLFPPDRTVAGSNGGPAISVLWAALAMAPASLLLAPLGEEILFRGVLFPGLRARIVLWKALLLSALAFAFSHSFSGIEVVYFLWVGLVLAWARHRTGGLLAPIVIHISINLYVFARTVLFS